MTAVATSYADVHLDAIHEDKSSFYVNTPPMSAHKHSSQMVSKIACKRVGNYLLGKTIGSGTSSKVKIGTNILTGRKVAVKITRPKRVKERKEIEREISILKLLKHGHIITLYDAIYEEDRGRICLILELVSGGELFDYIVARGRLAEKEARKFFRQILSGLIYCHANNVCHRDLKLENLLVDENGNIKISDFGYSNIARPGCLMSTFCGSPVYAPPEILLEKKYNGAEVDIWSIGVILYAMVTGQLPWSLTDGVQVEGIDRLLKGEFKYPSNVILSNEVKELINRMIVAGPSDRAKLSEIKAHSWVNKGYDMEPDEEYAMKNKHSQVGGAETDSEDGASDPQQRFMRAGRSPASPLYSSSPNLPSPASPRGGSYSINSASASSPTMGGSPIGSPVTTTPPLSPIASQSPPTPTTPTLKTSLFHGLFKKKQLTRLSSSNNGADEQSAGTAPSSPTCGPVVDPVISPRRRFSLEDIVNVIRGKKPKTDKLRSIKGPFNSGTTTMLSPSEVVRQIEEQLQTLNIKYQQNGFIFECKTESYSETITFEMEVCRVSGMEMFGIKFRRLCGDVWGYSTTLPSPKPIIIALSTNEL
eukprot:gene7854-9218_t